MKRLAVVLIIATLLLWSTITDNDRFSWPDSGMTRIEDMAAVIRKIEGPARWCYPSRHPQNLSNGFRERTRECLSRIEPAAAPVEVHQGEFLKQYYRAQSGGRFCEVTLSTVFGNDRVVGSDCFFGLFRQMDDEGLGMTDDPFG